MGTNLMDAHSQWANRPADERFWTLEDMLEHARLRQKRSMVRDVSPRTIRLEAIGEKGLVVGGNRNDSKAEIGHFAFGQLAGLVGAPASYLRSLPAELAAQNINYGLQVREDADKGTSMLLDCAPVNGKNQVLLRAMTSMTYGRIWNADVIDRMLPLQGRGWRVPPARPSGNGDEVARPATEADCLRYRTGGGGTPVNVGNMIAPAGLYGSDKDMFCFMVNEDKQIKTGGAVDMCRGFFIENSEVGDCAFKVTTFLYSAVCSNHIVWGVDQVQRSKVVHSGPKAQGRAWNNLERELSIYANASNEEMETRIQRAQRLELGTNKIEIVNGLFEKRIAGKSILGDAFEEAVKHPEDGHVSPRSVWGMVQGMTRLSQQSRHADVRVGMDRAASKILAMAN